MDVATMINRLAVRLEDPDKDKFTDLFKLKSLNNAQERLPQFIHNSYLTELQYYKANVTVTAGKTAALTASLLDFDPLRGGQGILKVRDNTTGTYLTQIGLKDIKGNENTFQKGTVRKPYFYIAGNLIYTLPSTGISAIDVYMMRAPDTMYYTYTASGGNTSTITTSDSNLSATADYYKGLLVYNQTKDRYLVCNTYASGTITIDTTGDSSAAAAASDIFYFLSYDFDAVNKAGVTCELNPCLHEIVLLLAEADCWAMDRRLDRRVAALNAAFAEIQVLNSRYGPVDGIGTSAYKRFVAATR